MAKSVQMSIKMESELHEEASQFHIFSLQFDDIAR